MKAKSLLACLALFLLAASLWSGQEEAAKRRTLESAEKKSLVRKDLLSKPKKELQPPRRNIFSPKRAELIRPEPKGAEIAQSLQTNPAAEPKPSSPSLNLSYIGYIVSGEKIIALIVLEGDILYVEKGDMIGEGIRVGEITPSEMEVIGPGSEKKKYSIQGD